MAIRRREKICSSCVPYLHMRAYVLILNFHMGQNIAVAAFRFHHFNSIHLACVCVRVHTAYKIIDWCHVTVFIIPIPKFRNDSHLFLYLLFSICFFKSFCFCFSRHIYFFLYFCHSNELNTSRTSSRPPKKKLYQQM